MQIYLSDEQRRRIAAVTAGRRVTMAEVIRAAIKAYVELDEGDLDASFGAARGIRAAVASRDEWTRG